MGTFGGLNFLPTVFSVGYQFTKGTTTVGNEQVILAARTGSDIDTLISSAATDIDNPDPGDWYDLIDISGKYFIAISNVIQIVVDSAEDADDALRCQILLDGVVAGDIKATKAVSDIDAYFDAIVEFGIFCKSSFKIRYAREGGFTDATSSIDGYTIQFWTL